jgi:hypothetical protein
MSKPAAGNSHPRAGFLVRQKLNYRNRGAQLMIINKLTLGPRWLAPALEAALLVPQRAKGT